MRCRPSFANGFTPSPFSLQLTPAYALQPESQSSSPFLPSWPMPSNCSESSSVSCGSSFVPSSERRVVGCFLPPCMYDSVRFCIAKSL